MTPKTEEGVAQLYVAFFDRTPTAEGLDYWVNQSELQSLEEIAQSFFDQPETKERYPDTLDNAQFITAIYENTFGREPTPEGLAYWEEALQTTIAAPFMILAISEGAVDNGEFQDRSILANKTEVALYAAAAGLETPITLDDITADPTSVESAIEAVDQAIVEANGDEETGDTGYTGGGSGGGTPAPADTTPPSAEGVTAQLDGIFVDTFSEDGTVSLRTDPEDAATAIAEIELAKGESGTLTVPAQESVTEATLVFADTAGNVAQEASVLIGTEGDDTLTGGEEDDLIYAMGGSDTLAGGEGIDTFVVTGDGATARIDDLAEGEELLVGQGATAILDGSGDPSPTLDLSTLARVENEGTIHLIGSDGDDFIIGTGGYDLIDGGDGGDTISGNGGDDTIDGGGGGDTISGGSGDDTIDGGDGDDDILGSLGDDTIFGDVGNDTIDGDSGNDTIDGGDGDDLIDGGDGSDTILTGDGNDTVVTTSPFAAVDNITDFDSGSDILKIDFKSDTTDGVADGKFGSLNTVDEAYLLTDPIGATGTGLALLRIGSSTIEGVAAFGLDGTGAGAIPLTSKNLLKGHDIGFFGSAATTPAVTVKFLTTTTSTHTFTASGTTVTSTYTTVRGTTNTITRIGANEHYQAVLFFYDTDDHVLKMFGLSVADTDGDSRIDRLTLNTSQTLVTLGTNGSISADAIAIF